MILEYILRIRGSAKNTRAARFIDELVETDSVRVHFYVDDADGVRVLEEAKSFSLGGPYSAVMHPPHVSSGDHHLHVYGRSGQLFAINRDGTAHDRSHGVRIPNRIAASIRKKVPSFTLPPDNIIEAAPSGAESLIESFFQRRESESQRLAD